jgi:hypothetical protein
VTSDRLAAIGVKAPIESRSATDADAGDALRLVVGPWRLVRDDPAVNSLRGSPAADGVFAVFKAPEEPRPRLIGLDVTGTPARDFGTGSGLIAALGRDGDQPTWIVTGSGGSAVRRAADALDSRSLRNRYAVAATGHGTVPLPIIRASGAQ